MTEIKCTNCGGQIESGKCVHCGSVFEVATPTARFVKVVPEGKGRRELFQLSPPLKAVRYSWEDDTEEAEYHEWVIVSAVSSAFDTMDPETFIFPANSEGEVTNWGELPGSFQGAMDIDRALRDAGYSVVR